MVFEVAVIVGYFLILYVIAFICNQHYRSENDILWVSRTQWKALFVLWLPVIIGIIKTL